MAQTEEHEKKVVEEWAEPPPEQRNRYDWAVIAEQLRSNPGEWALIFDDDRTSIANAVRQGSVKAVHPSLGFQVQTRNNTRQVPRHCSLYMKYVPPGKGGK